VIVKWFIKWASRSMTRCSVVEGNPIEFSSNLTAICDDMDAILAIKLLPEDDELMALFEKHYDVVWTDTRYVGGVAELYRRVVLELTEEDLPNATKLFVLEDKWHEGNRSEFQPRPGWLKAILQRAVVDQVS
jgi:hypothetical protein